MTESETKLIGQITEDYNAVLNEAKSMGCNNIKALYNIPLDNMELIVNALEKQIPKKIKVVEDIRNDGVKEYFAVCPNCDKGTRFCVGISNYNKYSLKNWIGNCYCSTCGQKLDWM